MRLADARWSEEDDVLGARDEAKIVQALHLAATQRRLEGEIEFGEPLDGCGGGWRTSPAWTRWVLRSWICASSKLLDGLADLATRLKIRLNLNP